MRTVKSVLCGVACLLAGCSIHPLPDDVTHRSTFHIVQKIRCEAREALTEISADVLQNSKNPQYPRTYEVGGWVRDRSLKVTDVFDTKQPYHKWIDPDVHKYFDTFALSALALGFTFDITETNDAQFDSNFQDPFSRGIFKLNAKAGRKLDRNNKRKFIVGETFLELYVSLDERRNKGIDVCDRYAAGQNFIYPITGDVGLKEVFEAFINLNSRSIDPTLPRARGEKKDSVALFVDTLRFTTLLTAGATPRIELAPVSRSFNLTNAQLAMGVQRLDAHEVAISLEPGEVVLSLDEAFRKVHIVGASSTRRAIEKLLLNRSENFLEDIRRRLDEPRP